jgi:oxalate decarboxylase
MLDVSPDQAIVHLRRHVLLQAQALLQHNGRCGTMDYKANDVGLVPAIAGHYLQNTGNDDMSLLALFKSSEFVEFSLDQWLRRLPVQMTQQHLRLSPAAIAKIPFKKYNIFRQ